MISFKRFARGKTVLAAAAVMGAMSVSVPAAAQYARVISNDMRECASGEGPAVRVTITGLRSSRGNLFVRTYNATDRDWLRSQRYLTRLDARPRQGSMTVCVPLDSTGRYAIAVQHDENGNREVDYSTDGVGMSNNPRVGSFLGVPTPPGVDRTGFNAGSGVTRITINMQYRN